MALRVAVAESRESAAGDPADSENHDRPPSPANAEWEASMPEAATAARWSVPAQLLR